MNKLRIRTLFVSAAVAALMFVLVLPATAAEPVDELQRIHSMAKAAVTAADHAKVAKLYRLRAESFDAKARKHEMEAARLASRPQLGLEAKWPSMVSRSASRERQLAMEARRAARECYAMAERHVQLAVEAELAE